MNVYFFLDGCYLIFMGCQNGVWYVFVWVIGGIQVLSNLIVVIGGCNEDLKFFFDGCQVVFKYEGDICFVILIFNGDGSVGVSVWKVVIGDGWSIEELMLFFIFLGKYVVYVIGVGDSLWVVCRNLENGQVSVFVILVVGGCDYYLVVCDYIVYFFLCIQLVGNDQLVMVVFNSLFGILVILLFNYCQGDNFDVVLVNEDYLIFFSILFDLIYSLFFGDIVVVWVWCFDLVQINLFDGWQKFGVSYIVVC